MNKIFVALLLSLTFLWNVMKAEDKLRIVSLAPSITENIYLLGGEDKLVGCTSYCTEALTDNKTVVGTAVNVNIEKLYSLKPDLVLTMQLTKPQDIETIRKLGVQVEVIPTPRNFEEICEQFLQIARLAREEANANKIIKSERQRVEELSAAYREQENRVRVFFQIGANPLFTVLENTFMDDYIQFAGGSNIASGMKRGTITRESVVLKDPEIVIIATMGGIGEEELRQWRSFETLSAQKNNKMFLIDSDVACMPTPVNFRKSLEQVIEFIYE